MKIRKLLSLLAIIIIITAIGYGYISLKSDSISDEPTDQAKLTNGQTLELAKEEADLPVIAGEKKVILTDLGMTCPACDFSVESALKQANGISAYFVNIAKDRATVVYAPTVITIEEIRELLANAGFRVGDVKEVTQ